MLNKHFMVPDKAFYATRLATNIFVNYQFKLETELVHISDFVKYFSWGTLELLGVEFLYNFEVYMIRGKEII